MGFDPGILADIRRMRQAGKPIIACFPLYPPLELFHAMGCVPLILWGLERWIYKTPQSDRHLQPYVCSVARRLTEFLLAEVKDEIDGIWMYNACDTLRNLPEIISAELSATGRNIPVFRMHIPMAPRRQTNCAGYLHHEIRAMIQDLEAHFGITLSGEAFHASVTLYQRLRQQCLEAEQYVAEGRLGFLEFCRVMQQGWILPAQEHMIFLQNLLDTCASPSRLTADNNVAPRVIISGILPPPEPIISLLSSMDIQIVGNDIALLRRSYADIPDATSDPVIYYERFYLNHFPCPTLLYTGDDRVAALMHLVNQRAADGVIFVGEKFCEYEYFEFPHLEKKLKEKGIPTVLIEISFDDAYAAAQTSRIQAFAEMIRKFHVR